MESVNQLRQELKKINRWERDQERMHIWEKIGRLPFWILDRMTPAFIQRRLNQLIGEISRFVDYGGRYLVKEKNIYNLYHVQGLKDIQSHPISEMDEKARILLQKRARFAQIQGATTGFGGFFTLVADIPILLGTSLKVLQEMALIYGYDPKNHTERIFIIKCLQFAFSEAIGKRAVLRELKDFQLEKSNEQAMSQLQGWREVFNTYREHISWKKLFQTLPLAGAIIGSTMNKGMITNVAETGQMMYKKRRIIERLKEIEAK
ncbi:EcsC family protein [Scopulibacillus cellulosilyticus]|uniref:EcsC family protein n=1 Tax=Scopulibacillus cellulosilyticus TaxID=2665665 RepID=A0ABW2PR11_9BACL